MKTATNSTDGGSSVPASALRLIAPPLRLVSASMWKVLQQRDVVHYGKLEETVTSICETVPGLLHYRHQTRLSVGLRALQILEELRQKDPPETQQVLQQLEKLQASSTDTTRRKDLKVEEAKLNFCTLIHSLLNSPADRKQFFQEEFQQHYGGKYVASLEKLLWEFLVRLDQLLPVPDLAQTVSWLSAAPAVLEECARTASQPQLLRALLQHESHLGHVASASLLSSFGDSILSSLSIPLSGTVRQTVQSEPVPASNRVINPSPSAPKVTRRTATEARPQITPVIGSMSNHSPTKNILTNKKLASSLGKEAEPSSGVSSDMRTELTSCAEGDQSEECFVGNVLVTVISQSSGSEAEEEENGNQTVSDEEDMQITNSQSRDDSPNRDCGAVCSLQANLSALLVSCMKRQLRVVIPRLNLSRKDVPVQLNHPSEEEETTRSLWQTHHTSRVRDRKRKRMDQAPRVNKLSSACSPCVSPALRFPSATPETLSPITDLTDDITEDSEDE